MEVKNCYSKQHSWIINELILKKLNEMKNYKNHKNKKNRIN